MPTGGVNLENIHEFRKAGAVAYGIGKSLVDTNRQMNDESLHQIQENAKRFIQAANA
jgi:2-dehydro-3-deoxyphosphogluconate aldolase/(4S)-4-hydroxy-2-oxoglutarate aldolase